MIRQPMNLWNDNQESDSVTRGNLEGGLIHEAFENQVARAPEKVALVHGNRSLTYAQLNSDANRLARFLISNGVGPDTLVGLCAERSIEMVVGMLGALKAGAAYLPIDPSYPDERIGQMIDDARPLVLLTQSHLRHSLLPHGANVIALDEALPRLEGDDATNISTFSSGLTPKNLLYVIYTSGSTGRPKGVGMTHGAMANLIEWHLQGLPAEDRRVLQFAALSFDVAFQEIFTTLCTGGRLVLTDEWVRKDLRALAALLVEQEVSRLFVPPLMLEALAGHCQSARTRFKHLKEVITAGEQLRISPAIRSVCSDHPGISLHNHYGPTETHVVTALTLWDDANEWPEIPTIGRAIANTRIYVVDEHMRLVRDGAEGEIYIAGANVARGYLNRPALTAERFICDPFCSDPTARMYKTGDRGRWRTDGTIEFLGRNDNQVKVRGYRIELGEIEARLAGHADVRAAAVIAREDNPGDKRLVAYFTPREEGCPTAGDLRSYLQSSLPDYMVPSAFVMLDKLPLTSSGKLSRRDLPAPSAEAYVGRVYEAPKSETERILSRIWQDLLPGVSVGRADNFFELGGDSLLMMHMMECLRQVGLSVNVRDVYEHPVLEGLARTLRADAVEVHEVQPRGIPTGCEAIVPSMLTLVALEPSHIEDIARSVPGGASNIQDIYPLAPLQEGVLFHHDLGERGGDTYVLPMLLWFSSRPKLWAFIKALQDTIARHDVLRTAILSEHLPAPVQVVYRKATLPILDVVLDPTRDPIEQLKERMRPEVQRLDLTRAPLMRLQVAADPRSEQWYAVFQFHHLVCDHESLEVMIGEIGARVVGRSEQLPVAVPYRDHVTQALAHARENNAEEFFRKKLGDVDGPTAPFGLSDVHGDGSRIIEARRPIDAVLAAQARALARRLGVGAATLFHAAWAVVVAHTSARDDIVFGTVLLGRLQGSAGARRALGLFINTLPLRLQLDGLSVMDLVEQTRLGLLELLNHEQSSLAVAQQCSGSAGAAALFSTLLNYLHTTLHFETERTSIAPGIDVIAAHEWTNYPITLCVDDQGDGFVLTAQTDRSIEPGRILTYMENAFRALLTALQWWPRTPALGLSILPEEEREQVVRLFNETEAAPHRDELLHELLEEQVSRAPDAVAVIHEGASITYDELNKQANRLGRFLRAAGVEPHDLVAVCIERSIDMIVGMLGVLKAGAAYVPLDPSNPRERLVHILGDARPKVLITREPWSLGIPGTGPRVVALDHDRDQIAEEDGGNLSAAVPRGAGSLAAYVIYTSGSTGRPKGVVIEHRSIVNYTRYAMDRFDVRSGDGTLICTSNSFDLMLTGLYPTLLCGRTVRLCSERHGVPELATELAAASNLSLLKVTPSHLTLLEDSLRAGELDGCVRVLVLGGEPLHASSVRMWRKHAPSTRIFNHYGPTEATVGCVVNELGPDPSGAIPIGRPIRNTQIYILDRYLQPAPLGVTGDIYIGGMGVARGYAHRPELTAERFIPDPFSSIGGRLYRSGDLGRWQAGGVVECLGRSDHQVKIRGYRVELGEIEAQLREHPWLLDALVLAREDEVGEKRVVAYVIPDAARMAAAADSDRSEEAAAEVVAQWRSVHDETYASGSGGLSFVGWDSSYTGVPIPEDQMREWLACTVRRIEALRPNRVLEIGCGLGLILHELAPRCSLYVGTDFSSSGLDHLRRWMHGRQEFQCVKLMQLSADKVGELASLGPFDTVILNSVVQYFPSIDYLVTVLREVMGLLTEGGRIFIGDLRHLGSLPMFHAAVQLGRAAPSIGVNQLRKRMARSISNEKELVIDPKFFRVLQERFDDLCGVDVELKRGRAPNELTRYRYDVVLHKGRQTARDTLFEQPRWGTDLQRLADIEEALRERRWGAVRLHSLPNLRLSAESAAKSLIEQSDGLDASAIRQKISALPPVGVDPESLWELADRYGYDVHVSWSVEGPPDCFDVELIDRVGAASAAGKSLAGKGGRPISWAIYANDPLEAPLRQRLIPKLRDFLKARVPDYMIPSAWMVLKQFPLTQNGKLDRRALPAPQGRPEEMGEYVAPRTGTERYLAEIWAQVLQVDQVGVRDNFFEIGGHSLLAMQVMVRMRATFSVTLPMSALFELPTVERLSVRVDERRHANLMSHMAKGGDGTEELLKEVVSLSDSQVSELVRELKGRKAQ